MSLQRSQAGRKRGEGRGGEERRGEERRGEGRRGEERRGEERNISRFVCADSTSVVCVFSMEMRRCLTSVLKTSNTDGPASGEYNLIPILKK